MGESVRSQADLVLLKPTTFSQVRDLSARLVPGMRKATTTKLENPS
jgi:hypothetical protein